MAPYCLLYKVQNPFQSHNYPHPHAKYSQFPYAVLGCFRFFHLPGHCLYKCLLSLVAPCPSLSSFSKAFNHLHSVSLPPPFTTELVIFFCAHILPLYIYCHITLLCNYLSICLPH